MAATRAAAEGQTRPERDTVGRLVDAWVASRSDVAVATRAQYEWAAGHIRSGLGSMPIDRLDRDDISDGSKASPAAGSTPGAAS